MNSLIRHLSREKGTTAMLLISSLIIGLCALAPSLFVIIVLNKYLASGITGTLISLTTDCRTVQEAGWRRNHDQEHEIIIHNQLDTGLAFCARFFNCIIVYKLDRGTDRGHIHDPHDGVDCTANEPRPKK